MEADNHILLFDGVCNLCNSAVQFVIKRDKRAKFRFAPLQSEVGKALLKRYNIKGRPMESLVYIADQKAYSKSTGVLHLLKDLGRGWGIFYGLILVPKGLRDVVYDIVARNRYKVLGKKDQCMVPTEELKARFLE